VGLKLNGTHQLLTYADHVNLMEDNIDTTKENTETLIAASMEVSLEVNAEKTKYMLLCMAVQIFGNDSHKSKFDSRGNYEENELG
jgi:hypothetical protein